METIKKLLPKGEHKYWDDFIAIHSQPVIRVTERAIRGEIKELEDFIKEYQKETGRNGRKKALRLWEFINRWKWLG